MTRSAPGMGRAAAACAFALLAGALVLVGAGSTAHAAKRAASRAPAPDSLVASPGPPDPSPARITPTHAAVDAHREALARAALEYASGNAAAVVATLAPLGLESAPPGSPDADRAAFLLAHAWLKLGQHDRFLALARAVAAWPAPTPFTRWLAFEATLEGAAATETAHTGEATTDALVASQLLRDGRPDAVLALVPAGVRDPLCVELRAQALERLGRDAHAEWELVAAADTTTALGRDLAGAALVRLATLAAERNTDPRPWLERVSAASRYASVARHMAALATLERGDAATAVAQLEALRAADPGYANRREVAQALAALAMDGEHWDDAFRRYAAADSDWQRARELLTARLAPDSVASLWQEWERDRSVTEALVLDGRPAEDLTVRLEQSAADLAGTPFASAPALGPPATLPGAGTSVPPPAPEAWDQVASSAREQAAARGSSTLAADSLAHERMRLADLRRYLAHGLGETRAVSDTLARHAAVLDSLEREMDETARQLMALRDASTLRFQRRAALVLERARLHEAWLSGMEHFYLDGPDRARQSATPPQMKGPDVVLAQEQELARSLRFSAGHLFDEATKRIGQSYEHRWGPRLIDRVGALADSTHAALAWSRAISRSTDSSLALAGTSAEEARLATRATALARRADELTAADAKLRTSVARGAVQHALAALELEREGLDYGLAAAAYARSVRLSATDTLPNVATAGPGTAAAGGAAADTLGAAETPADSVARRDRDDAIARASIFLADHPQSSARGEMRFRLADLLVSAARVDFRQRMAAWVRAQAEGRAMPLPVVDHAQALALYRRLLEEDTDFPHLDAVLFNAGMLLADAGDPGAAEFFSRLLAEHPASTYVQEASLRLGDLAIDPQRPDQGVADYERAANGSDPSLRAIALYKSGWAHYNSDRFDAAARAFRGVMDLYASQSTLHLQTDIEHEAEQYFVYSLAAAGGAAAFAREFPAGEPERPYARRVLRAMGQHFRRYGELSQATAADQLYLERWPGDPGALEVAGRLADTERRAERPDEERATRLKWAERFAPGGTWAQEQSSDSLRGAGEAFARDTWRAEAFEHHRDARTKGSRAEWQAALQYYETLLARWPGDSAARTYELHAGEACAELGEYAPSLQHYRAAASAGTAAATETDSVASRAAWQVVSVTDRWYESTRPSVSDKAAPRPGADSLARAFVREADAFLERHPKHPKAADIVWRECQLALAHGWNDDAQAGLARFARSFPSDKRAPLAAGERAEAFFRGGDYAAASEAFDEALAIAKRVGADTLARRAERALPVCAYRRAEAAVAADSTQHAKHAELFAEVARRWPEYEHAPLAQYRAGLAWLDAGQTEKGVDAFQALAARWPANVLAREARLKSAQAWEAAGDKERASAAYLEFAQKHTRDDSADEAWLKAADLADSAGLGEHAENLRKEYLKRWPNDRESALEILEKLAHRELGAVSPEKPLAALLAVPKVVGNKPVPPPSYLAQYLKLAAQRPALASKALLAEVRFQSAEEAYRKYDALRLTQPLPKSIAAKQKLLDSVLVRYRRTVDMGEPEWSHAAGYRIGQALVGFGSALEASERPADLKGDDLKAYENVLIEQSMTFHERGESVWSEELKGSQGSVADVWVTRTRQALWTRLGDRFLFQPDVEFPVVEGKAPPRSRSSHGARDTASAPTGVASEGER